MSGNTNTIKIRSFSGANCSWDTLSFFSCVGSTGSAAKLKCWSKNFPYGEECSKDSPPVAIQFSGHNKMNTELKTKRRCILLFNPRNILVAALSVVGLLASGGVATNGSIKEVLNYIIVCFVLVR